MQTASGNIVPGVIVGNVSLGLAMCADYVADWSPDEQERFLYGFAEAVAESLRLDDPAPARFYVKVSASRDVEFRSPQFTGEVNEDTVDALAARVGLRT